MFRIAKAFRLSTTVPVPAARRTYASDSLRVELREDLKALLKPEIYESLVKKTDYGLMKKLNFLGPVAITRMNTISNVQLLALNSQTCFRIVCFDLEDPWTYYWTKVKKNGNDGQKWLDTMTEIEHIPALMDHCFQTMMINGVYPTHEHYMRQMKAAAALADPAYAHEIFDEYDRCATELSGAPKEASLEIFRTWLNLKDFTGAWGMYEALMDEEIPIPADLLAQYEALEKVYNAEAQMEYSGERTVVKPQHAIDAEAASEANTKYQCDVFFANLQPQKELLISPDELRIRDGLADQDLATPTTTTTTESTTDLTEDYIAIVQSLFKSSGFTEEVALKHVKALNAKMNELAESNKLTEPALLAATKDVFQAAGQKANEAQKSAAAVFAAMRGEEKKE